MDSNRGIMANIGKEHTLEYVWIDPKELSLSTKNPRGITPENLKALSNSIEKDKEFLSQRPILVNRVNGRLIVYAGTQRLTACQNLGYDKVPVIIEDNLPQDVLDHRILLDNTHRGAFDKDTLDEIKNDLIRHLGIDRNLFNALTSNEVAVDKVRHTKDKGSKVHSKKLVFTSREALDNFYRFLEMIQSKYPDDTISNRILLYLSQQM